MWRVWYIKEDARWLRAWRRIQRVKRGGCAGGRRARPRGLCFRRCCSRGRVVDVVSGLEVKPRNIVGVVPLSANLARLILPASARRLGTARLVRHAVVVRVHNVDSWYLARARIIVSSIVLLHVRV